MVIQGFPKWDQLMRKQFEQNGQKLHENYKINIFGGKAVEDMRGQVGVTSLPTRLPPLLGETLGSRP